MWRGLCGGGESLLSLRPTSQEGWRASWASSPRQFSMQACQAEQSSVRHTHLKQSQGWQVDGATPSMQVLLDVRHLLFSLASPVSTLVPAQCVEAVRRARDKLLQERAADISLDFWRAARPAADVANNDDKLNAAKMRAVVRVPPSLPND